MNLPMGKTIQIKGHKFYRMHNGNVSITFPNNKNIKVTIDKASTLYNFLLDEYKSNNIFASKTDKINRNTKKTYKQQQIDNIIKKNWESIDATKHHREDFVTILYHGSRNGIMGDIKPSSRDKCDFGKGFYTGDKIEQAELLIKDNGSMKLLYTLGFDSINFKGKIYKFDDTTDILLWALYIACKREKIDVKSYPKLEKIINEIDSNDVIIGLIADDELTQAFGEFLANSLTLEGLSYCLSKVNLGHQYVFKTNLACNALFYKNIKPLDKDRLSELEVFHQNIIEEKNNIVEYALDNFSSGKRFRDIIKEYK